MRLFAYGTLADPAVLARVTGHPWPGEPRLAWLADHRRCETDLGYPAVFPHPFGGVAGVLWAGLTRDDQDRLDEYEDVHTDPPAYFRRRLTVVTAAGPVAAWVYVGNRPFFDGHIP